MDELLYFRKNVMNVTALKGNPGHLHAQTLSFIFLFLKLALLTSSRNFHEKVPALSRSLIARLFRDIKIPSDASKIAEK